MGRELAIEASGLEKRFGEVHALAGIDLDVARGSILGLLGPNGAGKTTAVRILSTVLRPDAGTARVLGYDVVREAARVRARIGLAGQFAAVDGVLTGRENLVMMGMLAHLPSRVVSRRADDLLDLLGLAAAADRTARTYSGGMRRRLDLAAALVHRPPVLFLDEPTTGLDPSSRADLWQAVRDLVAEGTTVLLTTQYLEEADALADRIVMIAGGRAVADGAARDLKAQYGRSVVELQMGSEEAAARGAGALEELGWAGVAAAGSLLSATADDGAAGVVDAVRQLDERGIDPLSAVVREPSLDDVFLALTGAPPTSGEQAEPAAVPATDEGAS